MAALAAVDQQLEGLVRQMQAEGLLDDQFQQLLALQDESNPDFVAEVVQLYFDDSASKIDKVQQLLAAPAPDYGELDQIVHQFKGSSASLGATAIAQLCIKLREGCQARDAAGCLALMGEVRAGFEALRGRLGTFLQLEQQRKAAAAAAGC